MRTLNDTQPTINSSSRNNRREPEFSDTNATNDLHNFIRPDDTFEHNMQLLEQLQTIESNRQLYDVRRRQLRILSDIMEDYQDNVQLYLQVITESLRSNRYSPSLLNHPRRNSERPRANPIPTPIRRQATASGLTDRQIELATRTIVYDASMNESRCPISLEDFVPGSEIVQIIGCSHIFKCQPLREWFNRNSHCPVCRYNIVTGTGRVRSFFRGNTSSINGNIHINGNTDEYSGNTHVDRSNARGNIYQEANAWTTILSGLLTSPNVSSRTFTLEREYTLPFEVDEESADT